MAKNILPSRTCVGCKTVRSQKELVRFVRTIKGSLVEDPTVRLAGRGAYICLESKEQCLAQALARHAFDRALPGTK